MRAFALSLCLLSAVLLSGCVFGLGVNVVLSDADQEQSIIRDKAALEKQPDNWLLHRRIGLAYFSLRQYAQAETSLQAVQALSPGEPVSLLYLSLSRIGKGERESALRGLLTYRWPFKFYHQKFVQEEAKRLLNHPEMPPGETIRCLLNALEEGRAEQDRFERDTLRGLNG